MTPHKNVESMTSVVTTVGGEPPARDCSGLGSGQRVAMEETPGIWREAGHSLGYSRLCGWDPPGS